MKMKKLLLVFDSESVQRPLTSQCSIFYTFTFSFWITNSILDQWKGCYWGKGEV